MSFCLDYQDIPTAQELDEYDSRYSFTSYRSMKVFEIPGVTENHIRRFVDCNVKITKKYPNWIIHVLIDMGRDTFDEFLCDKLLDLYYEDDEILHFAARIGYWSDIPEVVERLLDAGYVIPKRGERSILDESVSYSLELRQRIYDMIPANRKQEISKFGCYAYGVHDDKIFKFNEYEHYWMTTLSSQQIWSILEKVDDIDILFDVVKRVKNSKALTDRKIPLDERWLVFNDENLLTRGNWTFDILPYLNDFDLLYSRILFTADEPAPIIEKMLTLVLTNDQLDALVKVFKKGCKFPETISLSWQAKFLAKRSVFRDHYNLPPAHKKPLRRMLEENSSISIRDVELIISYGRSSLLQVLSKYHIPPSDTYLDVALQNKRPEIIVWVLSWMRNITVDIVQKLIRYGNFTVLVSLQRMSIPPSDTYSKFTTTNKIRNMVECWK